MKSVIALLFGCILLASCHKGSQQEPTESFMFTGQVTGPNGLPRKNIPITVEARELTFVVDPTQIVGSTVTDNNGMYKMRPIISMIFTDGNHSGYIYTIKATYGQDSRSDEVYYDDAKKSPNGVIIVDLSFK